MDVGSGDGVGEEMVASASQYSKHDVKFAFTDGANDGDVDDGYWYDKERDDHEG